jgi:hypothetical protein
VTHSNKGFLDWNIPKHTARFDFRELADGLTQVAVFPDDKDISYLFFRASYKPIPYLSAIPASTGLSRYVGLDFTHFQPPLPTGEMEELAGTNEWCSFLLMVSSSQNTVEWCDVKQDITEEDHLLGTDATHNPNSYENWEPSGRGWRFGNQDGERHDQSF